MDVDDARIGQKVTIWLNRGGEVTGKVTRNGADVIAIDGKVYGKYEIKRIRKA